MDQGLSAIPQHTSTSRGTCQVHISYSLLTCIFQTRKTITCFSSTCKSWKRGPVNAFSTEFLQTYGRLFDSLTEDGYDVRAVVLSSAFPKIFTAGLDCTWPILFYFYFFSQSFIWIQCPPLCVSSTVHETSILGGGDSTDSSRDNARASLETRKKLLAFQHAVAAAERAPFPVIAAVHGHVIGLGVDLISACDIRYAASNSSFSIKVGRGLNHFVLKHTHLKLFP